MRTREEQTLELAVRLAYPLHYDDGHLREAEDIILEAERRAEQRVRAEIARDRIPLPTYEAFCNSAKGLMSGEFGVLTHQQCYECDGSGIEERIDDETEALCEVCCGEGEVTVKHLIPWETIKQIYRAIVDEYAPKPAIDAAREVG